MTTGTDHNGVPASGRPASQLPTWARSHSPTDPGPARVARTRGEDMAERLLDAGRESFRTRGYDATRVDDIVELAGASHGTFYLYFRNKEDLLHRLAIGCADDLRVLAGRLESIGAPPSTDELTAWLGDFADSYRSHGPVIRVWLDGRDLDPLMQALADEVLGRLTAALVALVDPAIDEAVGAGLVRLSLLAMVERMTSYLEASDGELDRDAVVATQARLLSGLTAPRPGSPRSGR